MNGVRLNKKRKPQNKSDEWRIWLRAALARSQAIKSKKVLVPRHALALKAVVAR